MGSHPTLAQHPVSGHDPVKQARQAADAAFNQLNPDFGLRVHAEDVTRRAAVRYLEDLDIRGPRVRLAETRENDQPTQQQRVQVVRRRATHARQRAAQAAAERAFDRLNPDFGVPADPHDPTGRQAVRDREAGLALGTRVAVATSRENDPTPVVRVAGQDYRAADAACAARQTATRGRRGPERGGPER
jgi:hypothetical protein